MVLERRGIDQFRISEHGAQVREHSHGGAQAEQAFFGTLVRRSVVEFGQADGAHQRCVGGQGFVERVLRKRRAGLMDGYAADQPFGQFKSVAELLGHGMQDLYSRTGHFDADSVAG